MLDEYPPHQTIVVREQLHYLYPDRIIGRSACNNAKIHLDII